MITKDEALRILLDAAAFDASAESVPLESALGRILAADVVSDVDMPPFNRSAMDGYAVRSADVGVPGAVLEILEVIKAGTPPRRAVGAGQCSKIMTGAPVPDGADAVVMVEHTTDAGDGRVRIERGVTAGTNIAPRAQDLALDEIVLRAGTLVRPIEIGMLATVGQGRVTVRPRPTLAVIATGDELVPPGAGMPGEGKIRESNGAMLTSQIRSLGACVDAEFLGIAPDEPDALRAMIERGLERDVLVLSGGVSMGDFDFVGSELQRLGLEILIEKVAIKPGKPLVFGRIETGGRQRRVFGLPGNPVSSFVTFELFVRPFLEALCGVANPGGAVVRARVLGEIGGKAIPRVQHLPARVVPDADGGLGVGTVSWNGSGDLRGLIDANAMIIVPAGEAPPVAGATAEVMLLAPASLAVPPRRTRS